MSTVILSPHELLHFDAITQNPYGFEVALGALVRLGHTVRGIIEEINCDLVVGAGGRAKVQTPRGTILLEVGTPLLQKDPEWGGWDSFPEESYVRATVAGRTISEEQFLKMVGV